MKRFRVFFKRKKIAVADANEALQIGKLIEEMSFAPQQVTYLKYGTHDFRIFEKRIFHPLLNRDIDWKYVPTRKNKLWAVTREYVGSPVSIFIPPR